VVDNKRSASVLHTACDSENTAQGEKMMKIGMVLALCVTMTFFAVASHAAPADLWKTGQTTQYSAGDDGAFQLGTAWPSPRFINNQDGTVIDLLTGLMWLRTANCAQAEADWATAFQYIEELNASGTMNGNDCGDTSSNGSHQTDWRLPNRKELVSLLDYSSINPALPSGHPFTDVVPNWYWSSSTYASNTARAWEVSIGSCSLDHDSKTGELDYVWAVRDYKEPTTHVGARAETVPAMTVWGLGGFAALLAVGGAVFLRRRREV
jgi:MYXO-CTERM domain-containing protein